MHRVKPLKYGSTTIVGALMIAVSFFGSAETRANDWPQFRGPARNGISAETGLLSQFPAAGPKRVWGVNIGKGFSNVAVKAGRVYAIGNDGSQDIVHCLNAATGRMIWQYRYPCGAGDYEGPRATPLVAGNNVYTLSREGLALCLNAQTGKVVWQKNVARETGAAAPGWGFAGSPLLSGNLVVYNIGSAGTALDKTTGKIVWKSGTGVSGYSSPVTFGGGVAIFGAKGLTAVNPVTGKMLWQYPWETSYDVNAADPIFSGDTVFISSNYGKGGALLRVSGNKVAPVWQSRNMKNHFNTCVQIGSALYGNDENTLRCIDVATGDERWSMRGMGKGGLIAADGKLIVLTERGELVMIRATPDKLTELARAKVMTGTCWTQPVLSNGVVYCRSHEGSLVSYRLKSDK
ncbi:MAG: PQQ-binding-like beta-propeller repeat protein [Fibrella sp.]|nr:PQQ-binding-like beta-propeller repeat protein [Armatimonadota bacterium]